MGLGEEGLDRVSRQREMTLMDTWRNTKLVRLGGGEWRWRYGDHEVVKDVGRYESHNKNGQAHVVGRLRKMVIMKL
jgi:hypothetical protein